MKRYDVYRNLHKGGFSVRDRSTGRVVAVVKNLLAYDCDLVVQPTGRERVLQSGRKSVHAFVRCNKVVVPDAPVEANKCAALHYNPYVADHFYTTPNTRTSPKSRISNASCVYLSRDGSSVICP